MQLIRCFLHQQGACHIRFRAISRPRSTPCTEQYFYLIPPVMRQPGSAHAQASASFQGSPAILRRAYWLKAVHGDNIRTCLVRGRSVARCGVCRTTARRYHTGHVRFEPPARCLPEAPISRAVHRDAGRTTEERRGCGGEPSPGQPGEGGLATGLAGSNGNGRRQAAMRAAPFMVSASRV